MPGTLILAGVLMSISPVREYRPRKRPLGSCMISLSDRTNVDYVVRKILERRFTLTVGSAKHHVLLRTRRYGRCEVFRADDIW